MSNTKNQAFAFALLAAIWTYFLGNIGGWVAPEIVFNLMGNRGYSESLAGGVTALELLGVALGGFALAVRTDLLPVRVLALAAGVVLVISQYFSTGAESSLALLSLRFVCGLAQGVLMGLANAVLANGPNPHTRLAAANTINVVFGSILLFALAPLQAQFDTVGLFTVLAVICLLLTPFALGMQSRLVQHHDAPRGLGLPNLPSYLLVLAMAVFACGSGAAFTFSFLMGHQAGLEDGSINSTISIAVLGAIPGSLLCGFLGERFRPLVPMLLVLAVHAIATMAAATTTGLWSFAFGVAGILFGAYFVLPYMQGMSTRFDPLGGASAAIGGAFFLTMAGGAYVGGALVESYGLVSLGWMVVVGNLLTGLMIMVAIAAGNKHHAQAALA
jgi:DHA1 family inner membrane transport protein